MKFKGITKLGQEYLAKCLAENKSVTFSKVEIGSGNITEQDNPTEFTSLKTLKKEVGILSKNQIDNRIRLEIEITNDDEIQGFYPREVGIYVSDNGQDKLYCYINEDNQCSYLPPASEAPVKFKYGINFLVTSGESVIINWDGKELWVDKEYLEIELAKKEPKFSKNTAFNKNKTDSYNVNDSNILVSAKALYNLFKNISDSVSSTSSTIFASLKGVKLAYDRGTQAYDLANTKEPKITKKSGFNLEITDRKDLNDSNKTVSAKALKEVNDEVIKKATSTILGRVKIGKNLTITSDGTLEGKDSIPPIGSCILLDIPTNPAQLYLNTTWKKIEGKYIKTTSGSGASNQTGGSNTKILSVSNMPRHKHTASQSAHAHTQPSHKHTINGAFLGSNGSGYGISDTRSDGSNQVSNSRNQFMNNVCHTAGGGNTGSAQPSISVNYEGSGTAFNIEPSYITLHLWKRLS